MRLVSGEDWASQVTCGCRVSVSGSAFAHLGLETGCSWSCAGLLGPSVRLGTHFLDKGTLETGGPLVREKLQGHPHPMAAVGICPWVLVAGCWTVPALERAGPVPAEWPSVGRGASPSQRRGGQEAAVHSSCPSVISRTHHSPWPRCLGRHRRRLASAHRGHGHAGAEQPVASCSPAYLRSPGPASPCVLLRGSRVAGWCTFAPGK